MGSDPVAAGGQRDTAPASTALYRVHLIINADGFLKPLSYRTEEWAATFEQAWGAAQKSLRQYAKDEGWKNLHTLSYLSCERVPDTQSGGPGARTPEPPGDTAVPR